MIRVCYDHFSDHKSLSNMCVCVNIYIYWYGNVSPAREVCVFEQDGLFIYSGLEVLEYDSWLTDDRMQVGLVF